MSGEPKNEPGECNARLFIADNEGDSHATIRCQLPPGHGGKHMETYESRFAPEKTNRVLIAWDYDEVIAPVVVETMNLSKLGLSEKDYVLVGEASDSLAADEHLDDCPVRHGASVTCVWPIAVCVPKDFSLSEAREKGKAP